MQTTSSYRIRTSFLVPLGLVVLLSLLLLATAFYLQLPTAKIIILGAFLVPAGVIFAESSLRRVELAEDAVTVNKLLRSKRLSYTELTAVDAIRVRKRAFISLSSADDFLILSNSYAGFGRLLEQLLSRVPESVISAETREMAENPPHKCSDIFSAWLAVAVLVLIIFVQLRGAL